MTKKVKKFVAVFINRKFSIFILFLFWWVFLLSEFLKSCSSFVKIQPIKIFSTLKNPKIKDIYIKNDDLKYFDNKILSSYSALSKYTNITNNENIYAVEKDYFEKHINKNNQIQTYDNKYDNSLIQIELWRYSPLLIQDDIIDPISLYLLLKDEIDEEDTRINNAMDELYNQIRGMI